MSAETEGTREMYRPVLSDEGLDPTRPVTARDEFGDPRELNIAGECPLTIKVDHAEVVTLMTLGTYPEKLTLGYLRNQRLIDDINEIAEVRVDWDRETVDVFTAHGDGIVDLHEKIAKRTVTSGCGQGTIFSCTLDKLYDTR
ncbi:MAG: sulfurtransferase FdhD, partial [Proteobacteria bacterium]|nr:sulfurtransferase FdhD [Pseudomonadota bacterium]